MALNSTLPQPVFGRQAGFTIRHEQIHDSPSHTHSNNCITPPSHHLMSYFKQAANSNNSNTNTKTNDNDNINNNENNSNNKNSNNSNDNNSNDNNSSSNSSYNIQQQSISRQQQQHNSKNEPSTPIERKGLFRNQSCPISSSGSPFYSSYNDGTITTVPLKSSDLKSTPSLRPSQPDTFNRQSHIINYRNIDNSNNSNDSNNNQNYRRSNNNMEGRDGSKDILYSKSFIDTNVPRLPKDGSLYSRQQRRQSAPSLHCSKTMSGAIHNPNHHHNSQSYPYNYNGNAYSSYNTHHHNNGGSRGSSVMGTPAMPKPPHKQATPISRVFRNPSFVTPGPQRVFSEYEKSVNGLGMTSPFYDKNIPESYFEQTFCDRSLIGEGSFGEVYKVKSKEDNKYYAVKRSTRPFTGPGDRKRQLAEANFLLKLGDHPFCIRCYKAWEEKGVLYMQTELCQGGTLQKFLEKSNGLLPEEQIWQFITDIVLGLKHIHDNNIVHLDIKPANIFMSDNLKIGDYGIAFDLSKQGQYEAIEGDNKYMAQELLNGHFHRPADMFSLGILILEITTKLEMPSEGPMWGELRQGKIPDLPPFYSSMLKELIKDLLNPNPNQRPTASIVLSHPCIERVLKRRRELGAHSFKNVMKITYRKIWRFIQDLLYLLKISFLLVYSCIFPIKKMKKTPSRTSAHTSGFINSWSIDHRAPKLHDIKFSNPTCSNSETPIRHGSRSNSSNNLFQASFSSLQKKSGRKNQHLNSSQPSAPSSCLLPNRSKNQLFSRNADHLDNVSSVPMESTRHRNSHVTQTQRTPDDGFRRDLKFRSLPEDEFPSSGGSSSSAASTSSLSSTLSFLSPSSSSSSAVPLDNYSPAPSAFPSSQLHQCPSASKYANSAVKKVKTPVFPKNGLNFDPSPSSTSSHHSPNNSFNDSQEGRFDGKKLVMDDDLNSDNENYELSRNRHSGSRHRLSHSKSNFSNNYRKNLNFDNSFTDLTCPNQFDSGMSPGQKNLLMDFNDC